jgi:hypothetical protein
VDLSKCAKGKHDLVAIYGEYEHYEEYVVRWCKDCGAIVVDIDYDNRTEPGGLSPMRFSNLFKEHINQNGI